MATVTMNSFIGTGMKRTGMKRTNTAQEIGILENNMYTTYVRFIPISNREQRRHFMHFVCILSVNDGVLLCKYTFRDAWQWSNWITTTWSSNYAHMRCYREIHRSMVCGPITLLCGHMDSCYI